MEKATVLWVGPVFLTFLFFWLIVVLTWPYARSRGPVVPFFPLLFLAILFPPFFLIYLLFIPFFFTPTPVVVVRQPVKEQPVIKNRKQPF